MPVITLLLALVLLGPVTAAAQDEDFLVYRIDTEQSEIWTFDPGWKVNHADPGMVAGRFKVHLRDSADPEYVDLQLEDIDTTASPRHYDDFLPTYPGVLSRQYTGMFWGKRECDNYDGYLIPGEPTDLWGGTMICSCCPDAPTVVFDIVANPEPILPPQVVPAREPWQAALHWFCTWGEVLSASGNATVNGNQIDIFGDVTTSVGIPPTLVDSDLYSFTVAMPPLAPGMYEARYWERTIVEGQPLDDYQLQGQAVRFMVQGSIPTTGTAGTGLLALAVLTAGLLLLHRLER